MAIHWQRTLQPKGLNDIREDLLRRPDDYPALLLSGIYSVMEREYRSTSLVNAYERGFNYVVTTLLRKSHPKRMIYRQGKLILTSDGVRENVKRIKSEGQIRTQRRIKQLKIWLEQIRRSHPDENDDPYDTQGIKGGSRANPLRNP